MTLLAAGLVAGQVPERAQLEAAVQSNPSDAAAWYRLGLLLGQVPDFRGAETCFRKAVQLKPDFAEAHYGLALALVADPQDKLDWQGAMTECREALKLRPDYPEAMILLGQALVKTGDAAAAIPILQNAVKLKPNAAEAHFQLGAALEAGDRVDEAANEYRAALADRPGYAQADTNLGKVLFRSGKVREAEAEFFRALRVNPDLTDAHYGLARLMQSEHRSEEAAIEFDEAKALAAREADAMQASESSNRGLELAAKHDWPGAIRVFREAIALKPDYGVPHYNLGLILADSGDLPGAAKELAKGISLLPGQPKPWFSQGRVLRAEGDMSGARYAFGRALELSPSDAAVRAELDSMGTASAKDEAAGPGLDMEKFGAEANTADAHLAFALFLGKIGDNTGAIGELLRSLALAPASVEARRNLAQAYERLGDTRHSRLENQKVLILNRGGSSSQDLSRSR